jgi:hypothetical protein
MSGLEDNMTAKPGRRPRAPPKEEATFDTELQRYVMTSEHRVTTLKQSKK